MRVCPRCRSLYAGDWRTCRLDGEALIDTDQDPLVGATLERFRLVEAIGEGAMGRVYRARHLVLDRSYAIKVLFGDHAADSKFRERFRREAQAISKVRHPNIVTVEDFGSTPGGLVFLALELVDGESLDRRLAREGRLSPDRVRAIGRQVAAGLGAAHASGFVHRDVKPSNVMVTGEPPAERIKLLDFGTVGLQAAPVDQRITRLGHLIGTPTYMAPEQAHDPAVGPAADLYALGVILFELVTGVPPFRGADRAEILAGHVAEPPPPLPPAGGLERVIHRLLAKDPRDRPASAAEVIELLAEPTPTDSRPLFSMMPEVGAPELGFREWEQAASIEPYGFDAPPPTAPNLSLWGAEPAAPPSPPSLARDLTIDEAALLYEPAIEAEPRRDSGMDGDTQIDQAPSPDRTETREAPAPPTAPSRQPTERAHPEAQTVLDERPAPADAPLEAAPRLASVPSLVTPEQPTGGEPATLLDGFLITPVHGSSSGSTEPMVPTNGRGGGTAASPDEAELPPTPPEPSPAHGLAAMDEESTAAVRRRRRAPPPPASGAERWLLPLAVVLLVGLVAALVHQLYAG